ncbi:hypothetical protein M3J09_008152 [Ascochyta lentis]
MKIFIFTVSLILSAFVPATTACRLKYIEWGKWKGCTDRKDIYDGDCWAIERRMRAYSNKHQRVWGDAFTADNFCGSCEPARNQQFCTCTIHSWRFREWELEPGIRSWPGMPKGWRLNDPNNGSNGWVDTGHKNINCD